MEYQCGLDEAGRGPVIGPMVVACTCLKKSEIEFLSKYVSRDSKKYSKRQRLYLYRLIKSSEIKYRYYIISPSIINKWMSRGGKLNELELKYFLEITVNILEDIERENSKLTIYIDAPDVKPERFGKKFLEKLRKYIYLSIPVEVISEHRADEKYLPVSVASIIAKVIRDKEIEKLYKIIGNFGSGYPSDYRTREFIRKIAREGRINDYKEYIRIHWKTVEKVVGGGVEND